MRSTYAVSMTAIIILLSQQLLMKPSSHEIFLELLIDVPFIKG